MNSYKTAKQILSRDIDSSLLYLDELLLNRRGHDEVINLLARYSELKRDKSQIEYTEYRIEQARIVGGIQYIIELYVNKEDFLGVDDNYIFNTLRSQSVLKLSELINSEHSKIVDLLSLISKEVDENNITMEISRKKFLTYEKSNKQISRKRIRKEELRISKRFLEFSKKLLELEKLLNNAYENQFNFFLIYLEKIYKRNIYVHIYLKHLTNHVTKCRVSLKNHIESVDENIFTFEDTIYLSKKIRKSVKVMSISTEKYLEVLSRREKRLTFLNKKMNYFINDWKSNSSILDRIKAVLFESTLKNELN